MSETQKVELDACGCRIELVNWEHHFKPDCTLYYNEPASDPWYSDRERDVSITPEQAIQIIALLQRFLLLTQK